MASYPWTAVNVVLNDSEGPIDPILLGSFLKNFASLHNAVVGIIDRDNEIKTALLNYGPESGQSFVESVILGDSARRQSIARQYFYEHGSWLEHQKLRDDGRWLQIEAIHKNSPLLLVMLGSASALTAAVILSGGTIKMTPTSFEAKLPPLGVGLQAIRQAVRGGNLRVPQEVQKQIAHKTEE